MTKNESYSFGFYKALIEKVKNSRDAVEPENEALNKVSEVPGLSLGKTVGQLLICLGRKSA